MAACEEVFLVMEPEATEEQKDSLAVEAALFWNTVMEVLIELEDRGTNTDRVSRTAKDRPKARKARRGPRGESGSFGIALAPPFSDEQNQLQYLTMLVQTKRRVAVLGHDATQDC